MDHIEAAIIAKYQEKENSPSIYNTIQKVVPKKIRGNIDGVDRAIVTEGGRKRIRKRGDKIKQMRLKILGIV